MSENQMNVAEMVETLTGFEEIAISKRFGSTIEQIGVTSGFTLNRALAFVLRKRDGMNDDEAYEAVMSMPLKAVTDLFSGEDDDEIDPEEPETEAGKGGSKPVKKRVTSQP